MKPKAIDERTLILALAMVPGIGGKTLARITTRNEMLARLPAEFLTLGPEILREEYEITKTSAERWDAEKVQRLEFAKKLMARLSDLDVTFATPVHAQYPEMLELFDQDPPGLVFLHGNARLLTTETFCVLASRKAPPPAMRAIEQAVHRGIEERKTLVTGHDTPEYQRGAVVPLRYGAPRIMVLDRGFFTALGDDLTDEPFHAARLWRLEFDAQTDLALSTVNPLTTYHRNANRIRDRVVAGLSKQLNFAWINSGGTMETLIHLAIKAERDVRVSTESINWRTYVAAGASVFET